MQSKTLVQKLMQKQSVPRMGYCDKIWREALQEWYDRKYFTQPFEIYFQSDMLEIWNIDRMPIRNVYEVIQESEEWVVAKDGAGAILKNWKNKSGTPEHIDFTMRDFATWQTMYKPHLMDLDENRCNFEASRNLIEQCNQLQLYATYGNLGIWELLRSSLGDMVMFESLIDDPAWIADFNETYTNFFIRYYQAIFEKAGIPDAIWVYDDLAYNKGLFCSPKILYELFLPFYQQLTGFFHAHGISVIFHSCGNMEALLPFIVEAGFDACNPMEVKAGCDVVRFAEKFGDQLTFVGGLDVRILENGDRASIRKEIQRITSAMRSMKVPYLFGTDHSVTPKVAFEDYRYAVDYFRENAWY